MPRRKDDIMKISEALSRLDSYLGESVEASEKLIWLDRIEGIIYEEIILTHEDEIPRPPSCFEGERELICSGPYSDLYIFYMAMQRDMQMRDNVSYANNMAAFASSYSAFADHYNRRHMPKKEATKISL